MTIKRTLPENQYTFFIYVTHFLLELEMFQTKVVDKM
jgi:hypothetical protein